MSLVRLLTAGKSLVSFADPESRYRMRKKSLLPKFGSPENPFIARSVSKSTQNPSGQTPPDQFRLSTLSPAEEAAANLKETTRLPSVAPAPEASVPSKAATTTSLWGRINGMIRTLNPFARRTRRASPATSRVPRFDGQPVQAELSLDRVKVVRNDLNDADVEIVPVKPETSPTPAAAMAARRRVEMAPAQPG